MTRLDATRRLHARLTDQAVVASLGHPAYDLFAAGDRPENFYTWGSMGLASSIGLGLAMARPERRIVVLDGDGSLLMNLGSLATIAVVRPPNLVVIVWDNEEYATTGGQQTATAFGADIGRAAEAMGVRSTATVRSAEEFDEVIDRALAGDGPWVVVAKVAESAPVARPSLDYVGITRRFMESMRKPEA